MEIDFPLFVHIVLTYKCNSDCIMCPYVANNLREKKAKEMGSFMNPEIFYRVIDECSINNAFVRITGGGEPTLHPEFNKLMKYVKEKDAKTGIITNGSLLNRQISNSLLDARSVIEISVDEAEKESYEKIRKGLNWNKLIKNIENLKKYRKEIGSKSPIIVSIVNQKDIDIEYVKNFWNKIVDNVIIRKFLTWGVISDDLNIDKSPLLEKDVYDMCPYLFERLTIDIDGTFRICNYDILGKISLGNIKDNSIKDIWNGKQLKEYRKNMINRNWNDLFLCKGCKDRIYRSWKYDYKKVLKDAKPNIK